MRPRSSAPRFRRSSMSSIPGILSVHISSILAAAIAAIALAVPLSAQQRSLPPDSLLRAIEARGRTLAEYDVAAWHGTDAVMELRPADGLVHHYIARRTASGWMVSFGRISPDSASFLVAFEARQDSTPTRFRATAETPARADTGYLLRAARATELTRKDFGSPNRPYNTATMIDEGAKEPGGAWFVYFLPAPTTHGVWPHGGDVRYRVSGDGRAILEKRRMHNSVLEFSMPPGNRPESGMHTAIVDDIVEDTDVFLVLTRQPAMPEMIVSRSYFFRIDTAGRITAELRTESPPPPPR